MGFWVMVIDIYHSRRTHFNLCMYWNRDESKKYNINEYILKVKPQGQFYAKPVSELNQTPNQVNNVVMFNRNSITLVTEDDIKDIQRGSVVLYNGRSWTVDNVQFKVCIKENEFNKEEFHETYLSLRR